MKSASDMALPAIGVGLLYRKGYFRQTIDADGHQEHDYPDFDLGRLPLGRVQDASGLPLTVTVELPGRDLFVAVWVAQVGRVPVLLLDTDMPENADADRPITNILYVRGREMRAAPGARPGHRRRPRHPGAGPVAAVWHLNEGHSAFLLAERAREHVATGMTLDEPGRRSAATACSRSIPRSRPATSASTPTSSGAWPDRCSTRRRPGRELLELGLASTATQTSST
jgi:glucan phosphorylase